MTEHQTALVTNPAGPASERRPTGGNLSGFEEGQGAMDGIRAFCEGDYDSAKRRLLAALAAEPANPALLAACGHAFIHAGDREKALEYYARAEKAGASMPEIRYHRALLLAGEARWTQAMPLLEELFTTPPPVQPGVFYFGLFFQSREELLCDVALYLAQGARSGGNDSGAIKWLQAALEKRPDSVTVHQRLAEISILSKKFLVAINHLKTVLALSPLDEDKVYAHNNLGIACYENGMLDDAISHLTWVLRNSPGNPAAIHNLNYIYEREGIFQKEERTPQAIRFMDVKEGASPIFGLAAGGDRPESGMTVIGRSSEMLRVMRHARVAAASDSPVLLQGESGTGKEMLAQLITLNSSRREAPFSVVNCASMPELMLESELFGHEKGAFTGARSGKTGVFEMGAGGVVFLDDVTALTPMLQGKLLRALKERRFTPLGGARQVPLDVRLIAATTRPLVALVREGAFREDLYYELNVIPIEIPPLRERREDIPLLVEHFLRKHGRNPGGPTPKLPEDDLRILAEYEWPGNVRELENLIARAVVMGSQSNLYLEELARLRRDRVSSARKSKGGVDDLNYPLGISLAELERRHIMAVLEASGNNQRQAAKILGINPTTLWRKLKAYEENPTE